MPKTKIQSRLIKSVPTDEFLVACDWVLEHAREPKRDWAHSYHTAGYVRYYPRHLLGLMDAPFARHRRYALRSQGSQPPRCVTLYPLHYLEGLHKRLGLDLGKYEAGYPDECLLHQDFKEPPRMGFKVYADVQRLEGKLLYFRDWQRDMTANLLTPVNFFDTAREHIVENVPAVMLRPVPEGS